MKQYRVIGNQKYGARAEFNFDSQEFIADPTVIDERFATKDKEAVIKALENIEKEFTNPYEWEFKVIEETWEKDEEGFEYGNLIEEKTIAEVKK